MCLRLFFLLRYKCVYACLSYRAMYSISNIVVIPAKVVHALTPASSFGLCNPVINHCWQYARSAIAAMASPQCCKQSCYLFFVLESRSRRPLARHVNYERTKQGLRVPVPACKSSKCGSLKSSAIQRNVLQAFIRVPMDDDCFYYHSWRNNVVIAFGTLSSFLT